MREIIHALLRRALFRWGDHQHMDVRGRKPEEGRFEEPRRKER